ncbi:MAG TPA: hypothetical protein VD993_10545 [Chitinophagaceae bacterium]|nr:hypothetical protein [Chitinophagaceae bacterium]
MQFPAEYTTNPVPIEVEYNGKIYTGEGKPISQSCKDGVCFELDITLNNEHLGIIHCTDDGWKMDKVQDQGLVNAIGEEILLWYE